MASRSSREENAWLVRCWGMLYRPTGESHWVRWPSYLFLKGEEGRVAERGPRDDDEEGEDISAAVANNGVGPLEEGPFREGKEGLDR